MSLQQQKYVKFDTPSVGLCKNDVLQQKIGKI